MTSCSSTHLPDGTAQSRWSIVQHKLLVDACIAPVRVRPTVQQLCLRSALLDPPQCISSSLLQQAVKWCTDHEH
jgi:hypothetical protein